MSSWAKIAPSLPTDDRLFAMAMCMQHPDDFSALISDRLRDDAGVMMLASKSCSDGEYALGAASQRLRGDKSFVLDVIKSAGDGSNLEFASSELKADKEFLLDAFLNDQRKFAFEGDFEDDFMKKFDTLDEEFKVVAIKQYGGLLKNASTELKADKEVVLAAVTQNGTALHHASDELQADKEVVLAAMTTWAGELGTTTFSGSAELKSNEGFMRAAVMHCGFALEHASAELKADKEVVMAAVTQQGDALRYASAELKADNEVVLAAVTQRYDALRYASAELKSNEGFMRAAVMHCCFALGHASAELKADKEVVMAAVTQNGTALRYASAELKADKEVVLAAVMHCGFALEHASAELKANKEVVMAAVVHGGWALRHASDELKADKEVVMAAVTQHGSALQCLRVDDFDEMTWETIVLTAVKTAGCSEFAFDTTPESLWPKLVQAGAYARLSEAASALARYSTASPADLWGRNGVPVNDDESIANHLSTLEAAIAYTRARLEVGKQESQERKASSSGLLLAMMPATASLDTVALEEAIERAKAAGVDESVLTAAGKRLQRAQEEQDAIVGLKELFDRLKFSGSQYAMARKWCKSKGATSVDDLTDYADELAAELKLMRIPRDKLLKALCGASAAAGTEPEKWGAWRKAKAEEALRQDGFALHPLDHHEHSADWATLQKFLRVSDPSQLGKGKDVTKRFGNYNELRLASAWRIEHPGLTSTYQVAKEKVDGQMMSLERKGVLDLGEDLKGLPTKTAKAAARFDLKKSVNETYLLHGTSPAVLLSLLKNGLNERYSGSNAGTLFGDGVYLAEDVSKTDQYGAPDASFDTSSELHRRLYDAEHYSHEGSVFYVLVCRATLGYPARTQAGGRDAKHMETGEPIFPIGKRELAAVPGASPPFPYHSLIAELGKVIVRYREFIFFNGEHVLPEYLLAYHRCHNGHVVHGPAD